MERNCLTSLQLVTRDLGYHWESLEVDLCPFFLELFEAPPCVMARDGLLSELGLIRELSSLSKTSYSSTNHLHMVPGVSLVSFESRIVVVFVKKGERSKLACNNWM